MYLWKWVSAKLKMLIIQFVDDCKSVSEIRNSANSFKKGSKVTIVDNCIDYRQNKFIDFRKLLLFNLKKKMNTKN